VAARLIRGGIVVSMDPAVGDLPRGDVRASGQRILGELGLL
jgi:hypothetical protein